MKGMSLRRPGYQWLKWHDIMTGYRFNSHQGGLPEWTNTLLNGKQLKQLWNNTFFSQSPVWIWRTTFLEFMINCFVVLEYGLVPLDFSHIQSVMTCTRKNMHGLSGCEEYVLIVRMNLLRTVNIKIVTPFYALNISLLGMLDLILYSWLNTEYTLHHCVWFTVRQNAGFSSCDTIGGIQRNIMWFDYCAHCLTNHAFENRVNVFLLLLSTSIIVHVRYNC